MDNPIEGLAREPQAHADRMASLPQLVGVQLAGVSDAGAVVACAGITDLEEPAIAVTPATTFRPGSITKLLTATLVMQCVDDGLVDLDDPVTKHVPAFRLADEGAAEAVTVRHLLAHSSGIDAGDLFVDTGDDDASVARYIELLSEASTLFPAGMWMSYCNGGFVLAGHLVERLRDSTWDEAARTYVLDPLGMDATTFETGQQAEAAPAPAGAAARGHLAGFGGVAPVPKGTLAGDPMCTRGLGPAGSTLSSTASDLAKLAASHLGLLGARPVLSEAAAQAMRDLAARAPGGVTGMVGMGLSWQVWRGASGSLVPRIGGANPGQSGIIAADPEARCAVVALTNSDQGVNMVNVILNGMGPAAVPDDDEAPADLWAYAGRYECHIMEVEVTPAEGGLALRLVRVDDVRWGSVRLAGVMPGIGDGPGAGQQLHVARPVDRTTFATPLGPIAFIGRDDRGRPGWLRWRMRALRRIRD